MPGQDREAIPGLRECLLELRQGGLRLGDQRALRQQVDARHAPGGELPLDDLELRALTGHDVGDRCDLRSQRGDGDCGRHNVARQ